MTSGSLRIVEGIEHSGPAWAVKRVLRIEVQQGLQSILHLKYFYLIELYEDIFLLVVECNRGATFSQHENN